MTNSAQLVVLDSGPLGMLVHPRRYHDVKAWFDRLVAAGTTVALPEVIDYELRRELIRLESERSLHRLDELPTVVSYLPLTTDAMRRAAEYWARARKSGTPTAGDAALDADMILAAQATLLADAVNTSAVVATTNAGHLKPFVDARDWSEITPADHDGEDA